MTGAKKLRILREFVEGKPLIRLEAKYKLGWWELQDILRWGLDDLFPGVRVPEADQDKCRCRYCFCPHITKKGEVSCAQCEAGTHQG